MAVKIGINSNLTFGQSGSFYSSEIIINAAVGPNYISTTSQTLLPLPNWILFVTPETAGVIDVQYSPNGGGVWRSMKQGTSTLMFCDTVGSVRLFGKQASGTRNVRAFAIKQA